MFVLVPLMFLGISQLFEAGPAGIAFGTILVLILAGGLCYAYYAFYYLGGKEILDEMAGEAIAGDDEDTTEIPVSQNKSSTFLEGTAMNKIEVEVHTNSNSNVA